MAMHKFCLRNLGGNSLIVNLDSVLLNIQDNDFFWSILDFDGIGPFPNEMPIDEFCKKVLNQDHGFLFSWQELVIFSKIIYDCYNCIIVAVKNLEDLDRIKITNNNYENCMLVLELFDSTYWNINIKNNSFVKDIEWKLR